MLFRSVMNDEKVKMTLDIPKQLRMNIRIAAAERDRTVAAEIRDTLGRIYVTGAAPAVSDRIEESHA